MNRGIVTRPQAMFDIDDCFIFMAQSSEDKALQFFDAVRQTFAALARMPGMGSLYLPMQHLDWRKWPVKGFRGYLIFYRVHENTIEILRVLPTSRDIDLILTSTIN
jgi:toxin ParE1/3/4